MLGKRKILFEESVKEMQVESLTIQGVNEWNEDALISNEVLHIYGVADGASSLVAYRSKGGETGGRMASQIVKQSLESENDKNTILELFVHKANEKIAQKMQEEKINVKQKDHRWTTGLAVIQIHDQQIEFVQTGDCMILAIYTDGSYRELTRDHVAQFDNIALSEWRVAVKNGARSQKEIRQQIDPIVRANKEKMNITGGYPVLDGSSEAKKFLETGKINRHHLAEIIICSDGVFPHEALDSQTSLDPMQELANQIPKIGANQYVKQLIEQEEKDPNCLQYPRFKKSDDKTVIRIVFG